MFEFNWKKNKTVYLNLLGIKGISHTTAKKLCALLGISHNTLYSQLANHKLDLLNLLLNLYNKKTNILTINSLVDLIEYPSFPSQTREVDNKTNVIHDSYSSKKEKEIKSPNLNTNLSFPSPFPPLKGPLGKGGNLEINDRKEKEKQWVKEGNMIHNPIQNSLDTLKKENILSLIQLNTYRGRRFKFGYPVKGQRTRSNAKTAHRLNRIKYSSL